MSVSLFPCVFWPNVQLLAHSCMWLLFCQTIKPVLLKILSLSLFFLTGLPWLCLQHVLIKTEIWKDPDLHHHMIPVSEISKCSSKFAVMCLTLFSAHSLISTLNFSFFSHVICVSSHKFENLHFYSSTKFPSMRLISSWEFRDFHVLKMLVLIS